MKKVIAIILCIVILFSLTACGGTDTSSNNASTNTSQTQNNNQSEDSTSSDTGKNPAETKEPGNANDAIEFLEKQFTVLEKDEIKWDYNSSTKTIVISGEGPMRDYLETAPEWDKYSAEAEHVVISDKVTSVGAGAFYFFSALTDVDLGSTVEFIGKSAFFNCIALRTVNFPANLKYVGDSAFYNDLLHSENGFSFPDGMLYIGDEAFHSAFKENTVSIPASLSVIGDDAFANTFVSAFVVDQNNPEYASVDGVFYDKSITTLINYPADKRDTLFEIPDSVTTIRKNAIEVTNTLGKIVIPAGVSEIEEGSIFWNYALEYIDVDENNKNYKSEGGVLYTADSKLLLSYPIASERTEYTVLEGCERICDYALSQASNLTELHTNEGLEEIGSYSIYLCGNLAKAGLPKSLKVIDVAAFQCCDTLTRINFAGNNSDWEQVEIKEKNELLTDGSVQIYSAE
ncbi:MAG: leucine-rich repeat protein [Christensenellales bacterium]